MPDGPLNRAIRRTLLRLQGEGDLTDGQLLERFVAEHDEAAFEALVRRHGPMVLRVCRRVLGNSHDAEEAFQATFIVLARKAGAIGRRELVGGWLHGVASRVALKARTQASQRRSHEQPVESLAEVPQHDEATDPAWNDLRPVLDEELSRLPDRYRTPMVLCYLEGKTNSQAAEQLGWGRWTIATRLSRGRALLRKRLTRRGIGLSALALTALLEQEAVAAATSAPAVVVVKFSAAAAGSAPVAALAKAAIDGLFWAKIKTWALVMAAVVLVAGSVPISMVMSSYPAKPQAAASDEHPVKLGVNASLGGKRPFPDDNPWNQEITSAPVDPNSAALIASIGMDKTLRAQFGTTAHGAPHGVPYVVVSGKQPRVPVTFTYAGESDPGPYPIPPDAPIEAGPVGDPNRQMIVIDRDEWKLYELLAPEPQEGGGWRASVGVVFDLNSNALRPWGFTSADGAGLPVFPGLVRYDEAQEQKEIRHALRFSARQTRRAFVEPARHYASNKKDPSLPPMRVRLRADLDVSSFPPAAQVILTTLKKYGMFLASHGQEWALSGVPDPRWSDADLKTLERVTGKDFEVVKMGRIEAGEMPPRKK